MKHLLTTDNHISVIKEVLEEEAKAIMNIGGRINEKIALIVDMILASRGRVIVTGIGKSGIIGRKMAATFSSTGTPSLFLHPAEGVHGDLGMVTEADIVLALSKSGESEEVINLVPSIRRIGAKIIAITGNEKSTLAEMADHFFSFGDVQEACPLGLAPTTSTTLMLALGDAISIAVQRGREFTPEKFAVFHPGGLIGRRLSFTVHSIIETTKQNPTLREESTVKDAIFNLTASGMGAASIINGEGKIIGILTDGDIRRFLSKTGHLLELPVKELYNGNPVTIQKEALAMEALNLMQTKKITVLPVVNGLNQPIGMIHLHDITRLGFQI